MAKFISSVWDFTGVSSSETGYVTHDFLRWYGKLIPQLVQRIISLYTVEGDSVFANFGGSGTVVLEANLMGRSGSSIDANPLSVLVATVKANPSIVDADLIIAAMSSDSNESLSTKWRNNPKLHKWFSEESYISLSSIGASIEAIPNNRERMTAQLGLASIVKKSSRVDSRCVNHLVVDKNKKTVNVNVEFQKKIAQMNTSTAELQQIRTGELVDISLGDARAINHPDETFDLVISHPPYLGAIDYSNMYQLENALLGFDATSFVAEDISTTSLSLYIKSMRLVLSEMNRILKPGKVGAVVIGDNRKNGEIQPTFSHFIQIACGELGMKLEDIFIWVTSGKAGMSVTRRGNYIDHNYILIFRKAS